ncbi:MAG: hypothetical protein A2234_00770 [Elusimicrobia bacterium RIFOXYA2_FULL_58_8]|nr:MAG: hypothetical protein A2285_06110 [Elusimicrobia bacterium RIFOXYA12_FULL_57_11]OGS12211.1 MAG: hypothetical protein A2234_00770 [Elusimicrobia bacterium RIFOXYA2_FULL_58_8]
MGPEFKKTTKIIGKIAISSCLVAVFYLWLRPVAPVFLSEQKRREKIEPLIAEAKLLKITYESVLSYPYQMMDKPVVWCIQNRGVANITYEGESDKRMVSTPGGAMPEFYGNLDSACTDMLLIVKGVKYNSAGPGSATTLVEVEYISQL